MKGLSEYRAGKRQAIDGEIKALTEKKLKWEALMTRPGELCAIWRNPVMKENHGTSGRAHNLAIAGQCHRRKENCRLKSGIYHVPACSNLILKQAALVEHGDAC